MSNLETLHDAVESGNVDKVVQLLPVCAQINRRLEGHTALDLAVIDERVEIARLLLQAGADAGEVGKWGPRNIEMVQLLVRYGCDPNSLLSPNSSDLNEVEVLLNLGANPNHPLEDGQTPLYRACMRSAKMVKLLLKHGANPLARNTDGSHALHFCACWGHTARARALLDSGVPADYLECGEHTALPSACALGHYKVAKLLLERGADPDRGGCLARAAALGSAALTELLLRYGATPSLEALQAAKQYLPHLLTKAKQQIEIQGTVKHRWSTNSIGERKLEIRTKNSAWFWIDEHQKVVDLLSRYVL